MCKIEILIKENVEDFFSYVTSILVQPSIIVVIVVSGNVCKLLSTQIVYI